MMDAPIVNLTRRRGAVLHRYSHLCLIDNEASLGCAIFTAQFGGSGQPSCRASINRAVTTGQLDLLPTPFIIFLCLARLIVRMIEETIPISAVLYNKK
jgi:hypothetical protein